MDSDLEEEMDVDDPDPIDDLDLIHAGNEHGEGDGGNASGNDNNDDRNQQEYNGADAAAPGDADEEKKEKRKKRVVLNPQPKLNYHTLTGKRGLCAMKEVFSDIHLKGKGHELSDLNRIMTKLEYWTHRLFPRYNFDEVLSRIEKLGAKKQVQVYIKRMRLGMEDLLNPVSNEFIEEEPPSPEPHQSMDDAFDSLFPTEPLVPAAAPKPKVEITAEQRERMERNRQLALERRLARIEAQKEEERQKASENAAGPSGVKTSTSTSLPGSSLDPELMEENPDAAARHENLFECSQEVSSISKPSVHTPEVLTVNLSDSIKDNCEKDALEPSEHLDIPDSLRNESDLTVSGDLEKPASLSRFDEVSTSKPVTNDLPTIPNEKESKTVKSAIETAEPIAHTSETP